MTYIDPLLSDAKLWSGSCSAQIATNEQIDMNVNYLTYKVAMSVTCSTSLSSKTFDGGVGGDPPMQVTKFELVSRVLWGL